MFSSRCQVSSGDPSSTKITSKSSAGIVCASKERTTRLSNSPGVKVGTTTLTLGTLTLGMLNTGTWSWDR